MRVLIFCALFFSNFIVAQNNENKYTEAVDLYVEEDFETALTLFENFEKTEKHNLNKILYFKGLTLFELNRNEDALKVFDRNILLFPESFISYKGKGQYYFYLENYKEAIDFFSRAIIIDDKNSDVIYERGECYFGLEDYNLAISDYTRAIELNSNLPEYYISRCFCYHFMKEFDKSCADYKKAIALGSDIDKKIEFDSCK